MAGGEDVDFSTLNFQSTQTQSTLKQEMEHNDSLQGEVGEETWCNHERSKDSEKELEVLWRRVKTTASLLTYLKSKARIMAIPQLALTSCGITQLDGTGFIDRNGTPMSNWSKNIDYSNHECSVAETWTDIVNQKDEVYIREVVKSVQTITDVMESLLKRVIMAEYETASERQKVMLSQEEIIKKDILIKTLSDKLNEMDRFAVDTNCILNEMRQWVTDLVEETSRQRQRATDNEEELIRVKRDFESLKAHVSSLISVRETLISSEKQFQTIEKLFERLVAKTTQLETEKKQKETEVQKLMDENIRLNALVDKKEAQLLAMNEQCKVMALGASNI